MEAEQKWKKSIVKYLRLGWTSIWRCLINVVLKRVIKIVSLKFIFFVKSLRVVKVSLIYARRVKRIRSAQCQFQSFWNSLFIVDASKEQQRRDRKKLSRARACSADAFQLFNRPPHSSLIIMHVRDEENPRINEIMSVEGRTKSNWVGAQLYFSNLLYYQRKFHPPKAFADFYFIFWFYLFFVYFAFEPNKKEAKSDDQWNFYDALFHLPFLFPFIDIDHYIDDNSPSFHCCRWRLSFLLVLLPPSSTADDDTLPPTALPSFSAFCSLFLFFPTKVLMFCVNFVLGVGRIWNKVWTEKKNSLILHFLNIVIMTLVWSSTSHITYKRWKQKKRNLSSVLRSPSPLFLLFRCCSNLVISTNLTHSTVVSSSKTKKRTLEGRANASSTPPIFIIFMFMVDSSFSCQHIKSCLMLFDRLEILCVSCVRYWRPTRLLKLRGFPSLVPQFSQFSHFSYSQSQ